MDLLRQMKFHMDRFAQHQTGIGAGQVKKGRVGVLKRTL